MVILDTSGSCGLACRAVEPASWPPRHTTCHALTMSRAHIYGENVNSADDDISCSQKKSLPSPPLLSAYRDSLLRPAKGTKLRLPTCPLPRVESHNLLFNLSPFLRVGHSYMLVCKKSQEMAKTGLQIFTRGKEPLAPRSLTRAAGNARESDSEG